MKCDIFYLVFEEDFSVLQKYVLFNRKLKSCLAFFFIVSSVINQSRKRRFPDVFRKVFFKFQLKSFSLHSRKISCLINSKAVQKASQIRVRHSLFGIWRRLCTLVYVCLSEKLKSCLAFFPIVSSVINQSRRRQFPDESPIFWRFWWVKLTLK